MANTNPLPTWRRTAAAAAAAGVMAFKGLQDWIEVFRVGTHTDSKGRKATFTAADLDQMAENISGAGVPLVVGHPKSADPAYGWVKPGDTKREGDSLFVKATDINPAFEAAVDSGAYRERSISIVKDPQRGWLLQHVGWLGAAAPAVTGMAPLTYASADTATPADGSQFHEFVDADGLATSWAIGDVAGLLRGLRDWLIAEKGLDVANQVLPDYAITSVADQAARIRELATAEADDGADADGEGTNPQPASTVSYSAAGATGSASTITEADLQRIREEAAAAVRAEEALRFAAQGMELAELRAERRKDRIRTQIGQWQSQGLLLPAEVPGLAEFMAVLDGEHDRQAAEFSFSAADKSTVKRTPVQWFSDFVAGRKALVRLGRAPEDKGSQGSQGGNAYADVDTSNYQAISAAAQRYQSEQQALGNKVEIDAAVAFVVRSATASA